MLLLLLVNGATGDEDAFTVHQTNSCESFSVIQRIGLMVSNSRWSVAISFKMWCSFKAHVDGHHGRIKLLLALLLLLLRMSVLSSQMG